MIEPLSVIDNVMKLLSSILPASVDFMRMPSPSITYSTTCALPNTLFERFIGQLTKPVHINYRSQRKPLSTFWCKFADYSSFSFYSEARLAHQEKASFDFLWIISQ
eukprot:Sdes_comp21990_c0_seq1m20529